MLYIESFFRILLVIATLSLPVTIPLLIVYDKNRTRKRKEMLLAAAADGAPAPKNSVCKKKIRFSSSSFMLIIGTALVILSGIAFGVASWVKTTPTGRVSIIMAAAAASFAVSVLFRKVLKLDGTSAAFYSVGTVFSATGLVTAGCYKLMGDWLAISGDGCAMLIALASFTISVLSLMGAKMYSHKALSYVGLFGISSGLLCMALQATEHISQTAAVLIIMQAVITAVFHLFGAEKYFTAGFPIKNAADITAALYGGLSLAYGIISMESPEAATFIIFGVILIQTVIYGIKEHSRFLLSSHSVLALIMIIAAAILIDSDINEKTAVVFFGIAAIALFIAEEIITPIRTRFSIILSLAAVAAGGLAASCHCQLNTILVASACAAVVYAYSVFSSEKISRTFAGITSPILPICICFALDRYFSRSFAEYQMALIMNIAAGLMILFAFVTSSVLRKKCVAVYSNMVVSALILFILTLDGEIIFLTLALAAAHLIVSNTFKVNWTAFGSSIALIGSVLCIIGDMTFDSYVSHILVYLAFFAVFMLISRLFHSNGIFFRTENKLSIDTIQLLSWIFILFGQSHSKCAGFITCISLAAYLANFVRKNTDKNTAAVICTISTIVSVFAVITRPFEFFSNDMFEFKINLAAIAASGLIFGLIWKKAGRSIHIISSVTYLIAYAGLIGDAIYFHNAGNTIFVLAVTVGILLLSFYFRNKTWFIASSVSLIIITVWSSREYLMSLNWWAYLFIAGMILIGTAAYNEYLKKNGKTIRKAVSDKFDDWTW